MVPSATTAVRVTNSSRKAGLLPVEPGAYVLKFWFASGQAGRFEAGGGPQPLSSAATA
jgi:hypothetical protein